MPRLSLTLRLSALLTLAFSLIVATFGGALYLQRLADSAHAWQPPFPAQLAAIVELVEVTPPAELPRLQRALSTPGLQLSVTDGPWPHAPSGVELPALSALTGRYLGALGGRRVLMRVEGIGGGRLAALFGARGLPAGRPLRVDVGLRDGRVLSMEIRAPLLGRLIARPLAMLVLVLIVLIGLASLWGLWRQIGPLARLAQAVERLGTGNDGPPLRPSGAAEVKLLIDAFNRMRERISELLAARARMLAAISHDLGTYLTRLRLRIDAIPDPLQRAAAGRDIEDMHQLLRDTLTLSRLEAAPAVLERLDLGALVARELAACRDNGAAVTLRDAAPLVVLGDTLALRRVLANLIGNALRYAGDAEVELQPGEDAAELLVDDRGPGIPAAERAAVLEPFYRRDPARNLDDGGSGLGLAIVADIVRRHRGTLHLEDRPGGGLRVRVRLPLATRA